MANWRNKITVKQFFVEGHATEEQIKEISNKVYLQLKNLYDKENELSNKESVQALSEDYIDDDLEELEVVMENFKEIVNSNEIPDYEREYHGTSFDYEDWFNQNLEALYDLGDRIVFTTNNKEQKFIWID